MLGKLLKERIVLAELPVMYCDLKVSKFSLFTNMQHAVLLILICWVVTGCVSPHTAPIVESKQNITNAPPLEEAKQKKQNKQLYVVQRGDTLYGIALKHGVDYKELVQWNGIADPNTLKIGQEIDLLVPSRQSKLAESLPEDQSAKPTLFALPQSSSPSEVSPIKPSQI